MKLTRIEVNGEKHLAQVLENEVYDLNDTRTMEEVMTSEALAELESKEGNLVTDPYYVNLTSPKKIICVGLNYPKHTAGIRMKDPDYPLLFSKFQDTLIPHQADIEIYSYEDSYDYEGELVVVIGRDGFQIPKNEA
ncbi:MAG: fumarylacetoacetate hydrolase family protein, partial [Erysipelotrichaceae bacterium]|nr:fumarylacetoacetate hydrolase family protein [Erysipelotrichaceae bacterium]